MRDALEPNLLQTIENTPVIVHAGPFGNIAHGNSSVVGDLIGIRGGDYLITEAGFGADMGAERFFNIKCRASGLVPDAAVLVATVRALKAHSGKYKIVAGKPLPEDLLAENPDDVRAGAANLRKQIENVKAHGVTPVVAINGFPTDHASEHAAIRQVAEQMGARVAVCTHFADGGAGATDLARGRDRGVRGAERLPLPLRRRRLPQDQDRDGRHHDLRRRAGRVHAGGQQAARELRGERVRQAAGVHRQDPPVDLRRCLAEGRADRPHAHRPRGARVGRCRLHLSDLRRHAHDARPRQERRRPRSIDFDDDGEIVGLS